MKIDDLNIRKAFYSLIKAGRPDVYLRNKKNITSELYVDLGGSKRNVINDLVSEYPIVISGYRGTGKSTTMVVAQEELEKNNNIITLYLNLQSAFEDALSIEEENSYSTIFDRLQFVGNITYMIKEDLIQNPKIRKYREKIIDIFAELFTDNIKYYNNEQAEKKEQIEEVSKNKNIDAGLTLNPKALQIQGKYSKSDNQKYRIEVQQKPQIKQQVNILKLIKDLKFIFDEIGIKFLYIFMDDFSELKHDYQKLATDIFIRPIINSYHDFVFLKIATYPGQFKLENIDRTKYKIVNIDPFQYWEKTNVNQMEKNMVIFIEDILTKRLQKFVDKKFEINTIFDKKPN